MQYKRLVTDMREADRRKQLAKRMKYAVCIGTGIVIGIIAGICIGIDYNKTDRLAANIVEYKVNDNVRAISAVKFS